MSLFISFEGGEGTGKTTQARILHERLQQSGVHALLVREPGTTPLGNYLRSWLKREHPRGETVSHRAELLLFAAARAELVAKIVRPELERPGIVVIADRYADSSTSYQGYGRRIRLDYIRVVNSLATQDITPDVTFLLDLPPTEGLDRVGSAQSKLLIDELGVSRIDEEGMRRFEEESSEFHQRIRSGYSKMAKQDPARWTILDATRSMDEISEVVWARVQDKLSEKRARGDDKSEDLQLESPTARASKPQRRNHGRSEDA